jgi:hypothetical protein
MSKCFAILLAISLAAPCKADESVSMATQKQQNESTQIARWSQGSPNSSMLYRDGEQFKAITANGITVLCSLKQDGRHAIAHIVVKNGSDKPVDVLPTNFSVNTPSGSLPPIDAAKVSRSKELSARGLAWATGNDYDPQRGFTPGYHSTSDTSGNIGSSGDYGATTYTRSATNRGLLTIIARHAASSADKHGAIQGKVLRANTVGPGEEIGGDLLFPKPGSLRCTIAGSEFEI